MYKNTRGCEIVHPNYRKTLSTDLRVLAVTYRQLVQCQEQLIKKHQYYIVDVFVLYIPLCVKSKNKV